jgi:GT2 family glycosyltransferase
MKLSIIIVNYNVKYFLEQCLYSVRKASKGIALELIVVDNNSVDGSVEMLKDKFKDIILIENRKNTGFSVANNQGIEIAKGEYILLLNPDTVVQEDTFQKIIQFMDEHPDAGGLGVKMIDGKGNFLPESKRGLPTPMVAFFKIFGLARLFPKSRLFGKYHLGYLSNDEVHEVDVLAGAFMLMRKSVLEKVGLLDETFFMYGEDIDLSYRIQLGGYKNYYYPHTSIIHYKGESTKKSSVNYVFVFYNAMIIFAKKHFSKNNAKLFSFLINIAVYVRAGFAIFSRMINRLVLPFLDASTWYVGLYIIKIYWEHNHRYVRKAYAPELMQVAVPSYILAWLFSVWLMGGYDKPYKLSRLARGLFVGSLIIACTYAFLNEDWRFSRAIIILGAFWTVISSLSLRLILNLIGLKNYKLDGISSEKNIVIVATQEEGKRVLETIKQAIGKINFIGFVHPDKVYQEQNDEYLGNIIQLGEIAEVYRIDEVIFSTKNLPLHEIIHSMAMVKNTHVDYKIAPEESLFIIGSNSVDNPGDLYTIDINFNINKPQQSRNKQILDFVISLALVLSFPIQLFLIKHPLQLLLNCWDVLCMRKSWVGYINTTIDNRHLPIIKKGILHPGDGLKKNLTLDEHTSKRLNLLYAKHYQLNKDLVLIWRAYNKLGRKYGSTEQ